MHCTFTSPAASSSNKEAELVAINERLSLALQSSNQIAFDWHISDGSLYFSGSPNDAMKSLLLDTSKKWHSSAILQIIHHDDVEHFRVRLHEALKGTPGSPDSHYQTEVRLKDEAYSWRRVTIRGQVVERTADGRALRMVGTFSDIDDCKSRENALLESEHVSSAMLTLIRDISELKQAEAELKEHARNYQQLVELSPHATFLCQGPTIVLLNQAACRLLGARGAADLLGKSILDFVQMDDHGYILTRENHTSENNDTSGFQEQVWRRNRGQWFNAEVGATCVMYNDTPSVQLVVRDITERKRAEALQTGENRILNMVATGASLPAILNEIASLAETQSGRGICIISSRKRNEAAHLERYAPSLSEDIAAQLCDESMAMRDYCCGTSNQPSEPSLVKVIDWQGDARCPTALSLGLQACLSLSIDGRNRKNLGNIQFYLREIDAPTAADLALLRICSNLAGIAIESRASEERIRYLAHYDGLTSLPNRFLFKEYLDLALRNAQRHDKKFAVLFLDLDKFKEINDTLGHDAGDLVLREMARRLRGCLRHNDKIARMGGDEFYVLIEDLAEGADAAEVAQKLLDAAMRPIQIGSHVCRLSVSIGISIYPNDGIDGQTLLSNADKAMYRAKEQGKNAFSFFSVHEDSASKPGLVMLRPTRLSNKARMRLV